jgi:hypothetical protein
MRTALLVLTAVLAACATTRHDYRAQYTGSVPLVLDNQTGGMICEVQLAPAGQQPSSSQNWLDDSIARGDSRELDVKPGSYGLSVRPCGAMGNRRELPSVQLTAPTEIILFDQQPPQPTGTTASQVLTLRVPVPSQDNAMLHAFGVGEPCTSDIDCAGGTVCDLRYDRCRACGLGAACRVSSDCCGGLFCSQDGTCG